jgi:hypothetical protein
MDAKMIRAAGRPHKPEHEHEQEEMPARREPKPSPKGPKPGQRKGPYDHPDRRPA